MTLSDSLREKLKTPLGDLIPENQVAKETLQKLVADKYVISVGDQTTEKMINFGLVPSLQIVDNWEKRQKRKAVDTRGISVSLECQNPAAEISPQSIAAIKKALSSKPPVRITVDGEEDLLVIPACIHAPPNSVVLYGQPNVGLVVVPVTAEIRNKVQNIFYLINGA